MQNPELYPGCVEHRGFFMTKRISVYIDGANFYGGICSINKKYTDTKFDFEKYIKHLVGKNILVRVYYYNAFVKKKINLKIWNKQRELFNRLSKIKKCKVTLCTKKPRLNILGEEYHIIKGDDICLALDMQGDAYENKYDKAILISSDGDFTPLIERVKKLNKEVCVCYFENCVSDALLNVADEIKLINKKIIKNFFYLVSKTTFE